MDGDFIKEESEMLCVYNGRVCYLKYSLRKRRWCYIRQDVWNTMSPYEQMAYVDSEQEAYAIEDYE